MRSRQWMYGNRKPRSAVTPPSKVVEVMAPEAVTRMVALLDRHVKGALSPDVSNYAKGRTRAWLQREMPLGPTQREKPGLIIPELWAALSGIWAKHLPGRPQTGLAVHGRIGIRVHRDASYARPACMNVNLGQALWFHDPDRNGKQDYDTPREKSIALRGGEVIAFDCKHPHGSIVTAPDGDRWAIILWQVK